MCNAAFKIMEEQINIFLCIELVSDNKPYSINYSLNPQLLYVLYCIFYVTQFQSIFLSYFQIHRKASDASLFVRKPYNSSAYDKQPHVSLQESCLHTLIYYD